MVERASACCIWCSDCAHPPDVRLWHLADIVGACLLCPLSAVKRSLFSTGIYVCLCPKADIRTRNATLVFILIAFGKFVGDALVAIDAGLAFFQALLHLFSATAALLVEVHRFVGMAVAAFA